MKKQTRYRYNFLATSVFVALLALTLAKCSDGNKEPGTISLSTTLTSDNLASTNNQALGRSMTGHCGENSPLNYCLTPVNVSGMVFYLGIMMGEATQNNPGYNVPLISEYEDPSPFDEYDSATDLNLFDFAQELPVLGEVSCCGGIPYPSDSEAMSEKIESYFGFIDVKFTLNATDGVSSDLQGTHTVRTVYADITDLGYLKGDLLYSADEGATFSWCTASDCTQTSRPADALQVQSIADHINTDQPGSKEVPVFTVKLTDSTLICPDAYCGDLAATPGSVITTGTSSPMYLTETLLTTMTFDFTVNFDSANAVGFTLASGETDLSSLTSLPELVAATRLPGDPADQENTGLSATFIAEVIGEAIASSDEEEEEH